MIERLDDVARRKDSVHTYTHREKVHLNEHTSIFDRKEDETETPKEKK